MSAPQTLADRAVETLAAVKSMDEGIVLEDVDRHVIHDLKRQAEFILSQAFHAAQAIAYTAAAIHELHQTKRAA